MSTTVTGTLPVAEGYSASFVFYSLLIPALVLAYAYYRISRRRFLELAEKLPGPPGLPIVGNAFEFLGEAPAIFKHVYAQSHSFNDVMKVWIGSKLVVFLANPKDIEVSFVLHIEKLGFGI